jgi:acetyl-CoA decarbonylase/synthase complex subunit epsilon
MMAEIPGPTKAFVINNPRVITAMIKRSKRPLLVVGQESTVEDLGDSKPIDYMISLAKVGNIPVVATAHTVRAFLERGFSSVTSLSLIEIGERLKDQEWKGIDENGQHDLVLLTGFPYYLSWLVLSGLKHFAQRGEKYLTTVSIDRYYQPHASWSLPNLSIDKWKENLKSIIDEMEVK